ncbi:Uncharacterized protein BP5553_09134 [Venustampulla echinocandica]|uniref:Nitrate reductase [NADPH] n=1 Tax=Venustampulla echinocandica TaxID=2656787 RepID=A0A370TDY3_9HELO|nr:Uncharacterized protein BP5553_09134 [Venustampulla echinocandica]RDL32678.1 Uncharacterized protein BP5553_09134 [Venustampulla echinocandica]
MSTTIHPITIIDHPGSSQADIENEPNWGDGRHHKIGYRNRQDRVVGLTHRGDEKQDVGDFDREALKDLALLHDRVRKGDLVNFRDAITQQKASSGHCYYLLDFHLRHPDVHSAGWRYVLDTTEDWIKNIENWPANVQKREAAKKAQNLQNDGPKTPDLKQEDDWRRSLGQNKHHGAYASNSEGDKVHQGDKDPKKGASEREKLHGKYSAQEIALLRNLRHEKDYIYNLKQNNGKRKSPIGNGEQLISIDEADQFSPDNWIPRSEKLIRLTGKHPLNAEPQLTALFDAGLITPNSLHYVRNHGPVPHLLWETHVLEVEGTNLKLSMDDLKSNFEPINIPVALACDGNRRKELNMIKRSKGFNWGSGAVSCAYWKGPLLRDVLLAAGVPETYPEGKRYWVNFEGADELSDGKYATCIPFEYALDRRNDVILAYEMNDVPLPPDHGYPLRLLIPGYVGGRCVKWLKRIWVSDRENESHYHIWDNRVLPSFITEKDGDFATTMFAHPDTLCNEQNLNSVIVKPAQGERIALTNARKGKTYRIEGYAYDGGGHEVQRVEISLDGGDTWLYCIRKFPEAPIRHGNKYWTWLHWHLDVEIIHLLRAKSVSVRCFNVFKNTQPERPSWNIMGMMNNCWYVVIPEIVEEPNDSVPNILFRHPTEPGTGNGGWLKESTDVQVSNAKQAAGGPQKQFTREEIEKHDKEGDCWVVIDGKVYDATSVLGWHPGGVTAILGHAGKVHQETSDEFSSIHDGYAYQKLSECILGIITDRAKDFIKTAAEKVAEDKANSSRGDEDVALQKHRWVPVRLQMRETISNDTRKYTFRLPDHKKTLGLATCQHIQLGFHFKDKMAIRSYTPTRPIFPNEEDGTFQLVVKTYFPDENQPGGAMSNILDCMPIGEEVDIRGPTGDISYEGNGKFNIEGEERNYSRVTLVLGGSGVTPGYQLICRILRAKGDTTELRVIDANKSQADILLRDEMDKLQEEHKTQFKITHVLSHPGDGWKGLSGYVNADIIKANAFEPKVGNAVFLCGPPAMIQHAVLPVLKDWGYEEGNNCFGF